MDFNTAEELLEICRKENKPISEIMRLREIIYGEVNADEVNLNMSDFQSGMYMIQIETSEYTATKRISVAH